LAGGTQYPVHSELKLDPSVAALLVVSTPLVIIPPAGRTCTHMCVRERTQDTQGSERGRATFTIVRMHASVHATRLNDSRGGRTPLVKAAACGRRRDTQLSKNAAPATRAVPKRPAPEGRAGAA
jgi:hypothetical protein